MFVNMLKEVLDNEGKVTFRNSFSLDLSTTSADLIGYFVNQGYSIVDYSDTRRA